MGGYFTYKQTAVGNPSSGLNWLWPNYLMHILSSSLNAIYTGPTCDKGIPALLVHCSTTKPQAPSQYIARVPLTHLGAFTTNKSKMEEKTSFKNYCKHRAKKWCPSNLCWWNNQPSTEVSAQLALYCIARKKCCFCIVSSLCNQGSIKQNFQQQESWNKWPVANDTTKYIWSSDRQCM